MKVADLKKGMLLTFSNDGDCFSVYGTKDVQWLRVVTKPSRYRYDRSRAYSHISESKVALYIGTKKDLDIDMAWTDKFVLIDNKITAVDPSAWKMMKEYNA